MWPAARAPVRRLQAVRGIGAERTGAVIVRGDVGGGGGVREWSVRSRYVVEWVVVGPPLAAILEAYGVYGRETDPGRLRLRRPLTVANGVR